MSLRTNIDLIADYHDIKKADPTELLNRFNTTDFDKKREPEINSYERFVTMLVRATIFSDKILISRAFILLPEQKSFNIIFNHLSLLSDHIKEVKILDLESNQNRYEALYA